MDVYSNVLAEEKKYYIHSMKKTNINQVITQIYSTILFTAVFPVSSIVQAHRCSLKLLIELRGKGLRFNP